MGELVLTIHSGEVFINNRRRISISRTNLPRELSSLKGDIYWSATIVQYDEDLKILHAKIENYTASKSDFISAGGIPSGFKKITFSSLNREAIDVALGCKPKSWATTPGQQQDLPDQEVPQSEDKYPLVLHVGASGKIGAKDGYFFYQHTLPNGKKPTSRFVATTQPDILGQAPKFSAKNWARIRSRSSSPSTTANSKPGRLT